MSWEHLVAGSIPGPGQWGKNLALPPLRCRLRLWLRADPWPGTPCAKGWPKMEKKGGGGLINE